MLSVFLLSLYMCCVVCLWASLPELNKWMDGWMDGWMESALYKYTTYIYLYLV